MKSDVPGDDQSDTPVVETRLGDLTGVSLGALANLTGEDLDGMPERLLQRLATRGASISGYNGASGLSGDAKAELAP